ncbi:MAG: DUF333 domain-containing protein [Candidatus Woesearchaeota archaeon]
MKLKFNKNFFFVFLLVVFTFFIVACNEKEKNKTIQKIDKNVSIADPAAKFCEELGHKYEIITETDGSQRGICIINDAIRCDAWAHYRKECPSCFEYCKTLPHIMCVGEWKISGDYPDCRCQFVCTETVIR